MKTQTLPWRTLWLIGALALYLALASYQLGLPGLHYDEAAEAGVNAMQLVTGAPVTAFRASTIPFLGWQLPLMVQDYIGALNVYLVLPALALTGIGVPNLRSIAILTGLLTLILVERTLHEWGASFEWRVASGELRGNHIGLSGEVTTGNDLPATRHPRAPFGRASLMAITLLAASPSFVFWSRQGIFVTNLTQPLCLLCIWQGLRWLRTGYSAALLSSALAGGLAIYAKLVALWVIGPFVLLAGGWWLQQRLQDKHSANRLPTLPWWLALAMVLAFLLGIGPLLLFNLQTDGLWQGVVGRLDQSYYGVDNRDLLHNATIRLAQVGQTLRGDHLWYLGGIYANPLAPWLGAAAVILGLWRRWRLILPPLLLLGLTFLCSLFTISDLFITHYALMQPLLIGVIGLSTAAIGDWRLARGKGRHLAWLLSIFVLLWLAADLTATLRYHRVLGQSGGLADHSDASYHLAYYLRYQGLGAPIALDWGLAAPVRYLSEGTVTPIEIFGYSDLAQPDPEFEQRLAQFLANPNNIYLLHSAEQTVFAGRREALQAESQRLGLQLELAADFRQRDGVPLVEIWRAVR